MSWKGALRAGIAVSRAMERESRRKQKVYAQQLKQLEKLQELESAQLEVEEYENYIELIQSVHKEIGEKYDWSLIVKRSLPVEPEKDSSNSIKISEKLNNYRPGFFDKLFKREEKKRNAIATDLKRIQDKEEVDHKANLSNWCNEVSQVQEMITVGKGILAGDTSFYKAAIEEIKPFEEIDTLGSSLKIEFDSSKFITVNINVHDEKVIPKIQKSFLKSGKVSIKDLPTGRRNELYQDYVCSVVLRVGREIFALLPVDKILVNASGNLLDSSTGHLKYQTILSILLVRETMEILNFDELDPSDSLQNFKCNMNFKKAQGMSPVEVLQIG